MAQRSHEKVYGIAATRAVMQTRPQDVLRIAHSVGARAEIGELLREAARRRIAYEERSDEDLERITGAVHHEGICMAVRPRTVHDPAGLLDFLSSRPRASVVALDGVANPHNVGAIARTAAYLGIDALLALGSGTERPLTPAAVRVAEGGAERLVVAASPEPARALATLRARGVVVIGTDAEARDDVGSFRWPARAVVVMGSEGEGLRDEVRRSCDAMIAIPGTGAVESLNVSVAAGIVLASLARAHRTR